MTTIPGALDQAIRETVHHAGGVDLSGDPARSLSLPAALVTALFDVSAEAASLAVPEATVERQLEAWLEAGCVADARRLLAHALPPRHSLWWALLCLTEAHRQAPYPPAVADAFAAALEFVLDPTEPGRRACHAAAEAAGSTTAGGVIGHAAFLSGGSMAPPECPPVLPAPHLCGRMCGVAVYLASVRFNPARYKRHLGHFIGIGLKVARGELAIPAAGEAAALPSASEQAAVETVVIREEARGAW